MKRKSKLLFPLIAASSSLLVISSASAASGTWLGNGDAWNNPTAWTSGIIADASGFTANFTGVNLTSDVMMSLGANRTIGNITFTDATNSSHDLTLTGNTLTLAGGTTRTINVTQPDRNLTISSILAGTAGFTKTGQGTLTLTGSNTITGATAISGGGTLVLDYTTNDNRKLANNSTLTLGGGTIVMKGGTTATENFTSTAFSGNNGTFFVREGDEAAAKINLNGFTGLGAPVVSFSHENMATTDRLNTAAGNLGSQFTVGNRWAANATNAADGNIVGYTGATTLSNTSSSSLDTNFELSGGLTLTTGRLVNTLRIVSTADDQVLNLGTNILQMSNANGTNAPGGGGGGLLYAGGANGNYTINGTGSLRIENQNGQSMLINVFSGTLTVNTTIGSGSSSFVKSGAGTLVLGGTHSNSGAFNIYQGVVRAKHATGLGPAGTTVTTVQSGAAAEVDGTFTMAARPMTLNGTGISDGGALRNVSGNSTRGGAITIGTGGARINSDSGTLTLSGGVVTAGNTVTFGGSSNITVSTTAISGAGGLVKDGAGTTILSATNSYTGATSVNAGTLRVNGSTATNSTFAVASGATLAGAGTVGGAVSVSGNLAPGNGTAAIGTLTTGTTTWNGGSNLFQFNLSASDNTSDRLTINGAFNKGTGSTFEFDFLGSSPAANTVYTLASWSTSTTFAHTDFSFQGLTGTNNTGTFSITGNNLTFTAVPEASNLLIGGLLGLGLMSRRRKNA